MRIMPPPMRGLRPAFPGRRLGVRDGGADSLVRPDDALPEVGDGDRELLAGVERADRHEIQVVERGRPRSGRQVGPDLPEQVAQLVVRSLAGRQLVPDLLERLAAAGATGEGMVVYEAHDDFSGKEVAPWLLT